MIDKKFWNGKRVFITGHTGFKGSWLSLWLADLGAVVKGYALNPPTDPSLFKESRVYEKIEHQIGDIRQFEILKKSIVEFDPDILFHMAAQPLVQLSYTHPIETYEINVMGTVKVLEASLFSPNLRAIINVTTDKCYENNEWVWGYRENEPMGGYDPYSSSKGCAELITTAYRRSYMNDRNVGLASARAGNVIGGGDWAHNRLLPDILRAFQSNNPALIRNPSAIRPWQYVLEPLSGYLILAQSLYSNPKDFSEAWNFGPQEDDTKTVSWILEEMVKDWEGASWSLDIDQYPHEASFLKLDTSKARSRLNWHPTWNLKQALSRIVLWHRAWLNKENMQKYCLNEINEFNKKVINDKN